jgi:multidrug efflux system outer membrane protein
MPRNQIMAAICAAATLLLSGCALAPAYQRPPLPVADRFPGAPADAPAGQSAADIGWREFLHDARLRAIVGLALRENRDLRAAVLNVERVRAAYGVQRAAASPEVTLGAAAGAGNRVAGPRYTTGLSASWEPDFFGRLHSLSEAALQQYLASEQASRAARILLVGEVADQYLALRAADARLDVTRAALDTARAARQIVDLRSRAGIASELDLRQADSALKQTEAGLQVDVRLRAQAENALVLLAGAPLPADLPPPASFDGDAVLADVPAGVPSALLRNRPDILAAEHALRAETTDIGAARAAFFPDISLTAGAGLASGGLTDLLAGGVWSFVPKLAAPLFDGGARRAGLDAANVQRDIGVAQYDKAIQSAFREVADGLAARATYGAQIGALARNAADQQRRLALAQQRYVEGVDDFLAVLTAQTDLYAARTALVDARQGQLTSLVDLYRALGGGWTAGPDGENIRRTR